MERAPIGVEDALFPLREAPRGRSVSIVLVQAGTPAPPGCGVGFWPASMFFSLVTNHCKFPFLSVLQVSDESTDKENSCPPDYAMRDSTQRLPAQSGGLFRPSLLDAVFLAPQETLPPLGSRFFGVSRTNRSIPSTTFETIFRSVGK